MAFLLCGAPRAGVVALAALAIVPLAGSSVARDRCAASGSSLAVIDCADWPRAASLDPRYRTGKPRLRLSSAALIPRCRATELVFYAARDWLRLAPKLAEHASPCADYYISVPPLVADKTMPRPNQAWRIRALGRASTRWRRSTGRPGRLGPRDGPDVVRRRRRGPASAWLQPGTTSGKETRGP